MKLHKVTFYFIDFDGLDSKDSIMLEVSNARYSNRCINPEQIKIETVDIGEWTDEHRCNKFDYDLSKEFKIK